MTTTNQLLIDILRIAREIEVFLLDVYNDIQSVAATAGTAITSAARGTSGKAVKTVVINLDADKTILVHEDGEQIGAVEPLSQWLSGDGGRGRIDLTVSSGEASARVVTYIYVT